MRKVITCSVQNQFTVSCPALRVPSLLRPTFLSPHPHHSVLSIPLFLSRAHNPIDNAVGISHHHHNHTRDQSRTRPNTPQAPSHIACSSAHTASPSLRRRSSRSCVRCSAGSSSVCTHPAARNSAAVGAGADYADVGADYADAGADYADAGADYADAGADYADVGADYADAGADYADAGADYADAGADYADVGAGGAGVGAAVVCWVTIL
ncbi:hypothetical protein BLNAU_18950 [Blattamonas nauphoetae]|uniref:Uncharacterized protein n=1 Tax=Blattamonas nauphoetae TaxID=2049346 RepID=A0ABQ9X3D3_9EUKA|nr:hypothetical protein BLNAU_18950 [Blattamonas nauphoetae]